MNISTTLHIEPLEHSVDLLALVQSFPDKYPFLLESVAQSPSNSRYDILFAYPQANLWLAADGQIHQHNIALDGKDFFTVFDAWFQNEYVEINSDLPFSGGWFVFLAYEFAQWVEPVLDLPKDTANTLPIAYFSRIPAALIVDHQTQTTSILVEDEYSFLLEQITIDVQDVRQNHNHANCRFTLKEEEPQAYLDAVKKIKKYIINGDVFQVNLSRLWTAILAEELDAQDLYARLKQANPAPFAGLALFENASVISSSPERLVKVSKDLVETRPIAGTRPRVRDAGGDIDQQANEILQAELLAHPKERAEHVMLIDLERNDLGRICQPGTVEVNELMVLESYTHVHHIVSNVRGRKKTDVSPMDIIRAVFPGGTITGCPKVRCMEIIAELEKTPRMAYTGSMGYLNRNGDMDLNILIRTIIKQDNRLFIRAGAGIVADSDPEKELQETRAKARGMLNAL